MSAHDATDCRVPLMKPLPPDVIYVINGDTPMVGSYWRTGWSPPSEEYQDSLANVIRRPCPA